METMKQRCPFCPKQLQSRKDMHRHLKKIHDADMSDDMLDTRLRKLTVGDVCNLEGG